jgi:hypothetical protein
MKTYILTVSQKFPKYHQLAGDDTNFENLIFNGLYDDGVDKKIHTMRQNYDLWAKRFENINKGEALLSLRKWSGKPYASKQEVITNLTKTDGIGLEKLDFTLLGWFVNDIDSDYDIKDFARNDGLAQGDWYNWFKDTIKIGMEPLVIIHFTPFRYCV